ncbi:MAG: hypothetical protein LBJ67_05660 [Planctomycetaceae bacterium]|jgi:hypothetical protein|nr:hypothetical protein [Planctomycetaceae bacterium]
MAKEITVPIEKDFLVEKNKIITLFDCFFDDDFNFDFTENSVEIELKSLDYMLFQNIANKALRNTVF